MSKDLVRNTCKMGLGEKCCKYLAADTGGLCCIKIDPQFKKLIDAKTDMVAKGDNCAGFGVMELVKCQSE